MRLCPMRHALCNPWFPVPSSWFRGGVAVGGPRATSRARRRCRAAPPSPRKARHLLHHSHFPETRADLRPLVHDPEEREIIDWVEHWEDLRPTFEADSAPLMLQLDAFARRLLESLSSEQETRN